MIQKVKKEIRGKEIIQENLKKKMGKRTRAQRKEGKERNQGYRIDKKINEKKEIRKRSKVINGDKGRISDRDRLLKERKKEGKGRMQGMKERHKGIRERRKEWKGIEERKRMRE